MLYNTDKKILESIQNKIERKMIDNGLGALGGFAVIGLFLGICLQSSPLFTTCTLILTLYFAYFTSEINQIDKSYRHKIKLATEKNAEELIEYNNLATHSNDHFSEFYLETYLKLVKDFKREHDIYLKGLTSGDIQPLTGQTNKNYKQLSSEQDQILSILKQTLDLDQDIHFQQTNKHDSLISTQCGERSYDIKALEQQDEALEIMLAQLLHVSRCLYHILQNNNRGVDRSAPHIFKSLALY